MPEASSVRFIFGKGSSIFSYFESLPFLGKFIFYMQKSCVSLLTIGISTWISTFTILGPVTLLQAKVTEFVLCDKLPSFLSWQAAEQLTLIQKMLFISLNTTQRWRLDSSIWFFICCGKGGFDRLDACRFSNMIRVTRRNIAYFPNLFTDKCWEMS